jgi:hypothetical protein
VSVRGLRSGDAQCGSVTCEACPVNTFSNESLAVACEGCRTLATGLYQRASGQTACHDCLWNASVLPDACAPGSALARSWARVEALFALYAAHAVALADFYEGLCTEGFACLPCEPGHMEVGGVCAPCAHGHYQPNIGATACYACEEGQNTSAQASTSSSHCVCNPGHE